jgi:phenylpropionate dioxygenase-like ring-hydroxylating dioxygenase large terminal subunit
LAYDRRRIPKQPQRRRTYADYLAADSRPAPVNLLETGTRNLETGGLDPRRYTDRSFYERERRMWDRVWQVACREEHLLNVGDYVVYEVARRSYLVVRTSATELKAFPNACLHRGRKLRTESGRASEFRCPFHGFTWSLQGELSHLPCEWDFPHLDTARLALPRVQVATWAGWVFINPDADAAPLADYLDPIRAHYEPYLWEQSYLGLHVGKVLEGNWKVVQEAFMESFHSLYTHPQIVGYIDDFGCSYDVWEGKPHVNRMMVPFVAASPYVADQVSEQEVLDDWLGRREGSGVLLDDCATARERMARINRAAAEAATGANLNRVSDAELVDGWYYNVFPNLMLWGGYGPNMWYRFRPWRDDHEKTFMEVGYIMRHRADEPKPAPAELIELDLNTPWATVEALGSLGGVLDQDTLNMAAVQEGLNATFASEVLLARYQESRIRHIHQTLDRYTQQD